MTKWHKGKTMDQNGHITSSCNCGVCRAIRGENKGIKFSKEHSENIRLGMKQYLNPSLIHLIVKEILVVLSIEGKACPCIG